MSKEFEMPAGTFGGVDYDVMQQQTGMSDAAIKATKSEDFNSTEMMRKAELWDAFASLGRIRTLGWANLGEEGYQHLGFELWTVYGTPNEYDFEETNAESLKHLETFLDAWILTKQNEEKNANTSKDKE